MMFNRSACPFYMMTDQALTTATQMVLTIKPTTIPNKKIAYRFARSEQRLSVNAQQKHLTVHNRTRLMSTGLPKQNKKNYAEKAMLLQRSETLTFSISLYSNAYRTHITHTNVTRLR